MTKIHAAIAVLTLTFALAGAGGNIIKEAPAIGAAQKEVRVSFVGDLMVHHWQLDDARGEGGSYDFGYSFKYIKDELRAADLAVGNLETVFGGEATGYTDFPVFNAPDSFAAALKEAGFGLLTTANNHCNDRREAGILRTIEILDGLGIAHAGTYAQPQARDTILIRDVGGFKFAFLSYTYGTNGIPLSSGKPYLANIMSEERIKADIKAAKALAPDFIVVLPHMGNEYETSPKKVFKDWVSLMIESGADIVIASHPHVLQGAGFITAGDGRRCFAAYSLGNFVSSQRTLPRDMGVILNLTFKRDAAGEAYIAKADYVPTWVKFINADGRYDITVLPAAETLKAIGEGKDYGLREKDIARMRQVLIDEAEIFLTIND